MADGVESLIASIRSVTAPGELFSLAATAQASMTTGSKPGLLLAAHLTLLQAAHLCEGEPMDEREWPLLRQVLDALADLLATGDNARLDALGSAWRAWRLPEALR